MSNKPWPPQHPPWIDGSSVQPELYRSEGAVAILLNDHGQLLMQLRDDNPDIPYPGTWGLLGGVIEPGETSEAALRRELMEEIEFVAGGLTLVGQFITPTRHLLTLYAGTINRPIEEPPLHEGAAIRYFGADEMPALPMAPHLKSVLLDYFTADARSHSMEPQ